MLQVSQSDCQCFDLLVFRLHGQGALLGTRLSVLMEIIALGCWRFVFIGGRFASRASSVYQTLHWEWIKCGARRPKIEYNNKPKPKKVKLIYTIWDVIKQNYRELVKKKIPFKPNDHKYIGSYQWAVTEVMENMAEEDLAAVEEIAKDWSEQGAPAEVKLK